MFEIGWTELLFIGLVAVLVLKPKDYPEMMRSIGSFIAKARQMAGEFQGQFNDALKDAKLDDVKKTIDEIRDLKNMGPVQQVRDTFVKLADEATTIKTEVEKGLAEPQKTATADTAGAGTTTPGATTPADGPAPQAAALPDIEPPPFPTAPPIELMPPPPVAVAEASPLPAPAPDPSVAATPAPQPSETPGPTKAA